MTEGCRQEWEDTCHVGAAGRRGAPLPPSATIADELLEVGVEAEEIGKSETARVAGGEAHVREEALLVSARCSVWNASASGSVAAGNA